MKHVVRFVTYGALKRSKWEHGRPSRAREPMWDMSFAWTTESTPVGAPGINVNGSDYRLVGIARYPDRVESRYERYL